MVRRTLRASRGKSASCPHRVTARTRAHEDCVRGRCDGGYRHGGRVPRGHPATVRADRSPPEAATRGPAPGIIFHAGGPMDGGWRVVELWESQAAFDKFLDAPRRRAARAKPGCLPGGL